MTRMNNVVPKEIADPHRETMVERLVIAARATCETEAPGARSPRRGSLASTLRNHDMPFEEIRAVLEARDPTVVGRYMELHRERLAEQLTHRLVELDALERVLIRRSTVAGARR